jgi:hypothetical protein
MNVGFYARRNRRAAELYSRPDDDDDGRQTTKGEAGKESEQQRKAETKELKLLLKEPTRNYKGSITSNRVIMGVAAVKEARGGSRCLALTGVRFSGSWMFACRPDKLSWGSVGRQC